MSEDYTPTLVEITQLTKTFWIDQRKIEVLKDINFSIKASEMIAVIGPSGSGKSTLMHLIGTLDVPTSGGIRFLGEDIHSMSEDELATLRNHFIGFVFQAHYLLPEFSALENVMMPAFIQRMNHEQAENRAKELLEWVGLSHRLSHRPGELSGGERQRVALCRALVMRPKLLLADEPTGNLDEKTSEGIHRLLCDLNERWGVTTIVVTHNSSLAQKMQRCLRLQDGQLVEQQMFGDGAIE